MPTTKTRKRSKAELRQLRLRLVQWWDRLKDECEHLATAIRKAPKGTFTDDERGEALWGLEQDAWECFTNHRPKLPPRGRHANVGV